jgi:hypothetical protein
MLSRHQTDSEPAVCVFCHEPRQKYCVHSRKRQAQLDLPHIQPADEVVASTAFAARRPETRAFFTVDRLPFLPEIGSPNS